MNEASISGKLDQVLERYKNAMSAFEHVKASAVESKPLIMEVLVARDALQEVLVSQDDTDKAGMEKLFEADAKLATLDQHLKDKSEIVSSTISLDKWRARYNPPETNWWWFFEPLPSGWDRFDWVLNALTAGALALSASFMFNIYKAVSVGSANIATTFSTIAQAAGLAVLGGGAFSVRGQEKVQKILRSLHIPSRFFAEMTFIAALLLTVSVYFVNVSLDDYYYRSGQSLYKDGILSDAAKSYQQGMQIDPDDITFNTELGKVYESVGELDLAIEQYKKGTEGGDIKSINSLGRAYINRANPITINTTKILKRQGHILRFRQCENEKTLSFRVRTDPKVREGAYR